MNKSEKRLKIIEQILQDQRLSMAEISRLAGHSSGVLSKTYTRGSALSEENMDGVLDALQIEVLDDGSGYRYRNGAFVKIRLGQNILGAPDYSGLFNILDKYRGKRIAVYIIEAMEQNLLDRLDREFQKRIIREIPGSYMIVSVEDGQLLLFVRRAGFRNYLTQRKQLEEDLSAYGAEIRTVRDANITLDRVDRSFVINFLERHGSPVIQRRQPI